MSILNTFYNNVHEREAVKTFFIESLQEIAIDKAFRGESVEGIKEAKDMIDNAFKKLDELYGIMEPPKVVNSR